MSRKIRKTELELDVILNITPGPTAKALRQDRTKHFRRYEEQALDLEFEWTEILRAHDHRAANPDWERRYEVLDELPWSPEFLRAINDLNSSGMAVAAAKRRWRIIQTMSPREVLNVRERINAGYWMMWNQVVTFDVIYLC